MSLYQVKVEVARAAAELALAGVEEERKKLYEERIAEIMKPKLFGLIKAKTREYAEEYIKGDECCEGWRIKAWGTEIQAKEILDACAVASGDTVTLDGEDASFVKRWRI